MTPLAVVATLSEMGVVPISPGPGQLRLVAKEGNVPRGAVELARAHREVLVEFVTTGIKCSSCGSGDLVDDEAGLACQGCGVLAFVELEGSLIRADHLTADDEMDPDDVPLCDRCGRWCDTETLYGSWRCSGCDPDADARRRRTKRILRLRDRIVERAK